MASILNWPLSGGRYVRCTTPKDWLIDDKELWYKHNRGMPFLENEIPAYIEFEREKGRKTPGIFFKSSSILLATQDGRDFLELNAPGHCDFIEIPSFYGKVKLIDGRPVGVPFDGKIFWINFNIRLESIDWNSSFAQLYNGWGYELGWSGDKEIYQNWIRWPVVEGTPWDENRKIRRAAPSEFSVGIGYGIIIKKSIVKNFKIWIEKMSGAPGSDKIFVSNEMKEKIIKSKIGVFQYIPVDEI